MATAPHPPCADPSCPLHGIAASNAAEDAYWTPERSAEWAASLSRPQP